MLFNFCKGFILMDVRKRKVYLPWVYLINSCPLLRFVSLLLQWNSNTRFLVFLNCSPVILNFLWQSNLNTRYYQFCQYYWPSDTCNNLKKITIWKKIQKEGYSPYMCHIHKVRFSILPQMILIVKWNQLGYKVAHAVVIIKA